MLKVEINSAKAQTKGRFLTTGSAIAGTIEGSCEGIEMNVEVESSAEREKVLHVIRQAEQGCYAMMALRQPTSVTVTTTLNGESITV